MTACPTSLQGWTFKFSAGEDVFITGLSSEDMCKQECLRTETCNGYTFQISPPLNFCYLFSDISTLMRGSATVLLLPELWLILAVQMIMKI